MNRYSSLKRNGYKDKKIDKNFIGSSVASFFPLFIWSFLYISWLFAHCYSMDVSDIGNCIVL